MHGTGIEIIEDQQTKIYDKQKNIRAKVNENVNKIRKIPSN
jgi:hypothetical protein